LIKEQKLHSIFPKKIYFMIKLITIVLIYTSLLFGSIDDDIEAIEQAPIEDRFKLMNELKDKIAKMQEEKRMESIDKLKLVTNGELITLDTNETNSTDIDNNKKNILIERINSSIQEHSIGEDND